MLSPLTRFTRPFVAAIAVVLLLSGTGASTASAAGGVSVSTILQGYSRPVLVTAPRGSSRKIYIVEQTGRIKVATYSNGHWKRVGTFLDIRDRIAYNGEQGLLGLAFAPDYATSGRFYVNYTARSHGQTVIAEFRRKSRHPFEARKSSYRLVLRISQPHSNHNGGMIAFGPDDRLYIGMGDGGSADDPDEVAQDMSKRLGKMLRINPRDPDGRGPRDYSVPSDNPYVGDSGVKPEIWSRGWRNPWRWSFDRKTGDLWVGDVGQGAREEIDVARANGSGRDAGKGDNYGWDYCEGTSHHEGTGHDCSSFGVQPIRQYSHGNGRCAVTGGYVYRGPGYASWRGSYVYADYCTGAMWVITNSGKYIGGTMTGGLISGFGEDGAGRLFATDLGGRILRIRFSGTP